MNPQQVVKLLRSALVVLDILLRHGFVEEDAAVVRQGLEHCLVVSDGAFGLPQVLVSHGAKFVGVHQEGVALYRLVGVGAGAVEIIEVELGQGAVEIGLCEIRFGSDGLVEVLDCQHVVLEIYGAASGAHHLLGVDLRQGAAHSRS